MEIAQFTQDIRHLSGKDNLMADYLSRAGASNVNEPETSLQSKYFEIGATTAEPVFFGNATLQAIIAKDKPKHADFDAYELSSGRGD